jgi:hypothetical protein
LDYNRLRAKRAKKAPTASIEKNYVICNKTGKRVIVCIGIRNGECVGCALFDL